MLGRVLHADGKLLPFLFTSHFAFHTSASALAAKPAKAADKSVQTKKKFTGGAASKQAKLAKAMKGSKKKDGAVEHIDPRLQRIVSMLVPPEIAPLAESAEEKEAAYQKKQVFLNTKRIEHSKWQKDMYVKYYLQRDAMFSLPARLRQQALQPDIAIAPPSRNFFFETPPTSYVT